MTDADTLRAVLLVSCPDRPGIVAEVAGLIHRLGCNITTVNQSVDGENGRFRMRMVIESGGPDLDPKSLKDGLRSLGEAHRFDSTIHFSDERLRLAILCSHEPHCLHDLLQRHECGELACEIPVVISNHEKLRPTAEFFGVPFEHIPVSPDTREESERSLSDCLEAHDVDVIALARYMQILSPAIVEDWRDRIINIHHSFLPAFAGASPYRQAHDRGVKLIGATAHYVTAELDAGPIIAQEVIECSHRDDVVDLVRKGRDAERTSLARAVRCHIERRLLVQEDRVVVFE